jgi:hypothetical protein
MIGKYYFLTRLRKDLESLERSPISEAEKGAKKSGKKEYHVESILRG